MAENVIKYTYVKILHSEKGIWKEAKLRSRELIEVMNDKIEKSKQVVSIYLDFVSEEDLYIYSIDFDLSNNTPTLYINCTYVSSFGSLGQSQGSVQSYIKIIE